MGFADRRTGAPNSRGDLDPLGPRIRILNLCVGGACNQRKALGGQPGGLGNEQLQPAGLVVAAAIGTGACCWHAHTRSRGVETGKVGEGSPEPDVAAHMAILERERRGPVGVLFLGDSVMQGWANVPWIFNDAFGMHAPCNAGITSDRVQNVRWRIENGELEGIKPDVIVLHVGMSNLVLDHESPAAVAHAIATLTADLHARCPQSKIAVIDIFPASGKKAEAVRETNDLLAPLITLRFTEFYRVGDSIPLSDFPDGLHLSPDGYRKLADRLGSIITTMYYTGSEWPPHP